MNNFPEAFADLQPVIDVAYEAGVLLMQKWPGNVDNTLTIDTKADGSFVTEADLASNELIVSTLQRLYPEDGIVSEEIARDALVLSKKCVWILDPLDGTTSFIEGKDDFSILIARVENKQVIDSVMYFPAMQVMAVARRGLGAYINGESISVSPAESLRERSVYIRNFEALVPEYAYPDHLDSGMAFLSVARGDIDGAIMRMGRHQEWDLAAPSLLIQEAGGKISDDQAQEVRYNEESISYSYFLASNKSTHEQLFSLIPG